MSLKVQNTPRPLRDFKRTGAPKSSNPGKRMQMPPRTHVESHTCGAKDYFDAYPFVPCICCLDALDARAMGGPKEKPALLIPKPPTPKAKTQRKLKMPNIQIRDVSLKLVTNEHGFSDYDVSGHSIIKRVTVGQNMRKGENFNVYFKDGSKVGATWAGTLALSMEKLLDQLKASA